MPDVAVVSVVSSGLVGLLGAFGGFYAQRVTLANERCKRLEERRADLRAALAAAATAAMTANRPIEADCSVSDSATEYLLRIDAMEPHLGQLGIRLGPRSPAYQTYSSLRDRLFELEAFFVAAPSELTHRHVMKAVAGEASHDPALEPLLQAIEAAQDAEDAFLEAAAAIAGSVDP